MCSDVVSVDNFPSFPASIMDGYAVRAPLLPGILITRCYSMVVKKFCVQARTEFKKLFMLA